MRIKEAEHAANIIQVMFEGGLQGFKESQGALMYIPQPIDLVYIKHDNLGEDIINRLKQDCPDIQILDGTHQNFSLDVLEEVNRKIDLWASENLSPSDLSHLAWGISSIACIFSIQGVRKDSRIAIKFEEFLKSLPGHALSFVVYDEQQYKRVEGCSCKEEEVILERSMPKRNKAIDQDDLINLQIALNTASSVEEFLNSI